MKAIFKIQWENGTPSLPEGIELDGISANESIIGNGLILAQVEASPEAIEALKESCEFVREIDEDLGPQ